MINSLAFIKDRIKNGQCNNIRIEDFGKAYEYNFNQFVNTCSEDIQNCYKNNTFQTNLKGDYNGVRGSLCVTINYNPEAEFEYFTMESCCCDGTLMFYNELMETILKKLLGVQTYNNQTVPKDLNNNLWDYDVKYTVGDFVLNSEYGEQFATEEKPWILNRFTVMLPIKCEFIKK